MIGQSSRKNSSAIAQQIFSWNSQEQCRRGGLRRRCRKMRGKLKQWERLRETERQYLDSEAIGVAS
jgi:hypothetical protein